MKCIVSLFRNKFSVNPIQFEGIAHGNFLRINKPRLVPSKEAAPLFSPAIYREGGKRCIKDVLYITALVFDYDTGIERIDHHSIRGSVIERHVWYTYTTFSHDPKKPKWRLVIPLKNPVKREDWKRAWIAACEMIAADLPQLKDQHDISCKDPSRMYYLPAVHPDRLKLYERSINVKCQNIFDDPRYEDFLDLNWDMIPTEEEEKREIKKRVIANRKKHAMKYANKKPSLNDHKKMIRDSLDIDPSARSICGERLGGIIKSDRIVGIDCPQCHRKTVYFYPATVISYNAESKRWIGAVGPVRCSHRNNCGYVDSLKNLWRDRGSP